MKNPRQIIADVAAEFLGLRETSTNRGPHLAEFWKATGYPDGADDRQPWCSAFVSFCVQEADRRSPFIVLHVPPTFAAVAQWKPWAEKASNGCLLFTPEHALQQQLHPLPGDIVSFLPKLSHIGIVAEEYSGNRRLSTIEGNTNSGGSREGDGVYRRERPLDLCGLFIRIPVLA